MSEALTHKASDGREQQLRNMFSAHVQAGNRDHAIQFARLLLSEFESAKTYRFIGKIVRGGESLHLGLRPFRLALLSSFSIEFIQDALLALGFASGLRVEFYQAGYGVFRQEILDSASGLYAESVDLAILAVEGEDWQPDAYGRYSPAQPDNAAHKENFKHEIAALLGKFRANTPTPLLIHNFTHPPHYLLGIADGYHEKSQSRLIQDLNEVLHEVCTQLPDTYVLGYDILVSRIGHDHWYDQRMKHYAKFPLTQDAVGVLAREYLKYCRALLGLARKCLVLDLDNTLWGGVVGEDGLEGIQLGSTYPGSIFVEFQQNILGLHSRGVILAVASKNNLQDVEEVFVKHSSMVLGKANFSAFEVHWNEKEESLNQISKQLNISLDHIVFVDDNPAECEQVRLALPMVTVIQLPTKPEQYSRSLFEDGWFDTLSISAEDLRRSSLYGQRAEAEVLRKTSTDLEGFYRDLDMTLSFSPVNVRNLTRATQLTQKTNQFNTTTRRYSEGDIAERMNDPAWRLAVATVTDRFGDNGIVGLVMACCKDGVLAIDTFLLSCRVIGRTVETAMLAYLCEAASTMGATSLRGEIIPTAKNAPVRDIFERHAFVQERVDEDGTSIWRLNCNNSKIDYPDWFKIINDKSLVQH
jgi:FkbH-like protein